MGNDRFPPKPVLLVDDESSWLLNFSVLLRTQGINNLLTCRESSRVMNLLADQEVTAIALDLNMPGMSGEELLPLISREHPDIPIIVVTGDNQIDTAVQCMKLGAFDYFVKSSETGRLISGIRHAINMQELARENQALTERLMGEALEHPGAFTDIVTNDKKMKGIFQYIEAVAPSSQPLLIVGESGVGKELIAKAIHTLSGRKGEFVPVNLGGVDETVFSDTLFGHEKGAFTGADKERKGLVERAKGGTLFLDEIAELSPVCQIKLLRLIQEREYLSLGSDALKYTDTRIVTATNRQLAELRSSGDFRNDLYFRLSTHTIQIPPLRERKDDVQFLVDHFLEKAAASLEKPRPTPPAQLYTLLRTYPFPGNVRELESMVFDAVSLHISHTLSMDSFIQHMGTLKETPPSDNGSQLGHDGVWATFSDPLPSFKEVNRLLADEAMIRAEGNQAIAGRMLGVTRQALNRRLKREDS